MDAARALADLTEISSQVECAVLFGEGGAVLGSTLEDDEASASLVRGAGELLEAAGAVRSEGAAVGQLEASTPDGSVFVVRDGARGIVATTGAQPTVGLVFYDLKSCLRSAAEADDKPKRRRRAAPKAAAEEGSGEA
jgi:predicted regulator of Ras-like GTPase activity (Roadblock/LC7/MglB family)